MRTIKTLKRLYQPESSPKYVQSHLDRLYGIVRRLIDNLSQADTGKKRIHSELEEQVVGEEEEGEGEGEEVDERSVTHSDDLGSKKCRLNHMARSPESKNNGSSADTFELFLQYEGDLDRIRPTRKQAESILADANKALDAAPKASSILPFRSDALTDSSLPELSRWCVRHNDKQPGYPLNGIV